MAEKDFVGEPVKYSFSGIIPLDDLYKAIYRWFKLFGYKVTEKEHKAAIGNGKRDYVFTWVAERKVTDYIKYIIETDIKVSNLKEVKTKEGKKKYYKGEIKFTFAAYLLKDYEEMYGKNPLIKFMRETFDKYLTENKMRTHEKQLSGEMLKLINEIKAFLTVQRLSTADLKE